jgi:response regulator NasT
MRILIAEDEPLEAEGLRHRLQALGHVVQAVVYDGAAAVTQAAALGPDLIFLDLRMPKLDGITAAEQILASRPVPIVLVTGLADPPLLARAKSAGIAAHVVKPVDRPQLEQALALAMAPPSR